MGEVCQITTLLQANYLSQFIFFSFFVFKDVFVNAKSMGSFVSTAGSTLEEHMWPASLTFG